MTAPVIANSAAPVGIVLIDPATGLPYSAAGGGVAVSAGTNSFSSGTLVFSNSNGVTFGMSPGGVITATVTPGAAAGIAAVQLPNTTYTSGTVNFLNSNGLSFGSTTGGGVTGSYTVPGATVFSNSNNVSFGLAGSTVTATATVPIGIGAAAAGTQTGTSGTLVFANSNGLSFGMSGSSQVTGTYTVPGATVFSNSNNVSFGLAGSTVTATATFSGGGAAISAAGSSQNAGTIVFSNSNGVSFGMNGSTVTGSVAAQTNQTIGIYGSSQTTGQSSSGTIDARSLSLVGAGNISVGLSGNSILISGAAGGQTNQSLGLYASSQTTGQSSSTTVDARSLSLVGAGIISVGMSAGSLLISAPGTTGLTQLSAGMSTGGNTTGTTGMASAQLVLAGGSNITLSGSTNAGSMTVTVIGGAGGAGGTLSLYGTGNTTQNSSTTLAVSSLLLNALGAMTVGYSNGSIQLSAPVTSSLVGTNGISVATNGSTISVSQISPGIYGSSNTTGQSSSSTYAPQSLSLVGAGNVSVGWSNSSLVVSGGGGGAGISAGTQSTGGGTVVFSNSNGISFGMSNSSVITASYTVPTQSNQTVGLFALVNTTQNSSTTLDARSISFNGLGELTVGFSNGSIQLSAPSQSVGVSSGGNTSGNTGTYAGQVVFAGGNNITLSVASGAGGAQTITISGANAGGAQTGISGLQVSNATYTSGTVAFQNANGISFGSSGANGISASYTVPAQTNQTVGLYAVGNTTQNSSTTLDARTLSFDALGAMTVGYSNGSVQLSAPATSTLSGTGQISISTNGSTISVGVPSYGTLSYWDNDILNGSASFTQLGAGSVILQALKLPANLSISALREFFSGSFSSSSNSSFANTISVQAGIYTLNGSSLSLASSGSQSFAFTNTSNNSISVLSGIKGLTIPLNASMTPGNYWVALWSNTASANANWATISNVIAQEGPLTYNGLFGAPVTATNQAVLGAGAWSTTSANLPASIGLSHITGSTANFAPFFNIYNVSA